MASTFFGVFTRKRKREVSTTSSEATSVGSSGSEESELMFLSPSKKRLRKRSGDISPKKISPTFNQLVDDDVSFKIIDAGGKLSINSWSVQSTSSSVDKVGDLDDSFTMPESTPSSSEPRRSPNGYILPDPLPAGLILTDLKKGQWKIGKSVGLGGFGEIYSATSWNSSEPRFEPGQENYVVKVEPHTNGPLFVERNFYIRAAKAEMISDYKEKKKLGHLGVPGFVASGSFVYNDKKLRFLVMPRFGVDLQSVIDESGSILSTSTTASIAKQVIDSYEYLHSTGWVHKDLKGSNLLFSLQGPSDGKVFLVDYGLVSKLTRYGLSKPNVPDLRSAHEGTLEFCSRDAHQGCISRRSDFEVLLFNVIDWLGGKLPWDVVPQPKPTVIQEMKEDAFKDVQSFLKQCFKSQDYPAFVETLMNSVAALNFHDVPDYNHFRSIFSEAERSIPNLETSTDDDEVILRSCLSLVKTPVRTGSSRNPSKQKPTPTPKKRKMKISPKRFGLRHQHSESPEPELEPEPELPSPEILAEAEFEAAIAKKVAKMSSESLLNPTPAMLEQMERMKNRSAFEQSESFSGRRKDGGRRRRRRSHRQRRKSTDSNSSTSEAESVECLDFQKDTPRSPIRQVACGIRSAAVQRSVEKTSSSSTSFRKNFDGFFSTVTKSIFQFQK